MRTGRMTASELQDLIVSSLARRVGGTQRQWRMALGAIILHDRATHPHCNWSVRPSGGVRETAAIERLLDTVRLDHPMVSAD